MSYILITLPYRTVSCNYYPPPSCIAAAKAVLSVNRHGSLF